MADESTWEKLRKELSSPWDWVAAGIGAAGGLAATLALHGLDGGTSAGIGALTVVSARKAGVGLFRSRGLNKRAKRLVDVMERARQKIPSISDAKETLERDIDLWRKGVLTHDQFETLIDQHIEKYRQAGK